MAFDYNNALDESPKSDGITDFKGGQYSSTSPSIIPKNCYAEGKNIDLDPFARPVTRRGAKTTTGGIASLNWEDDTTTWDASTKVWGSSLSVSYPVDAIFFFATNASQYLIAAQNGSIYQGTESSVFTPVSSATYSGSLVYFAQLNNRLYYCDATNALKYIDSALSYSAITAGKVTSLTPLDEGAGYTTVPAVTFSSGAAAATAVLGYGGRVISYTVTAPSSGYSSTTPPSATIAAAPAGGTTATCRVNISQTPSKPKFLVSHGNRLVCCSADTSIPQDTVYFSDLLDGESWDLVGSSVRVGGDGDPITGIYPWFGNNLLVFKQRSVWVIDTDPLMQAFEWPIKLISNRVGCVGHRTIQSVGSDVFFLSRAGIQTISQIESGAQSGIGIPISQPIADIVQDANLTYSDYFCSIAYKNRYLLAIATGSNTRPNKIVVWNDTFKCFVGYWTGWAPRDFCITGFSGNIRMNFGDASGRVWTWDDYTTDASETGSEYRDDTTDYDSYIVTRAFDHGDPLVKKLGDMVQVITENTMNTDAVTASFSYAMDESTSFTALDSAITITAGARNYNKAWNLIPKGKYRNIRFKLSASSKKLALTGLAVTGFSDTLIKQI